MLIPPESRMTRATNDGRPRGGRQSYSRGQRSSPSQGFQGEREREREYLYRLLGAYVDTLISYHYKYCSEKLSYVVKRNCSLNINPKKKSFNTTGHPSLGRKNTPSINELIQKFERFYWLRQVNFKNTKRQWLKCQIMGRLNAKNGV